MCQLFCYAVILIKHRSVYKHLLQFKLVLYREVPQHYTDYHHKQEKNKNDASKFTDYG